MSGNPESAVNEQGDNANKRRGLFTPALLVMYLDTFMIAVGFFMFVPILGYYFINELGWSAALSGSVLAISGLAQQGLKFLCGLFADRAGYKATILIGLAARAAGFAMYAIASEPAGYAAAAFVSGLGGALFHPASYAAYAKLTGPLHRQRIFAIREMLSNTGFVIGPVLGMFLLGLSFEAVSYTAAGMFVLTLAITWLLLPGERHRMAERIPVKAVIRGIMLNRRFLYFNMLMIGLWALNVQLYLAVPVRAAVILEQPDTIAYLYTAGAVFMVICQLPLTRMLEGRVSSSRILSLGAFLLGIGLFSLGFANSTGGLLLSVLLFMLGQMLAVPTMNGMVAEFAPQMSMAAYFGFSGLGLAAGGFLGNSGAGYLYDLAAANPGSFVMEWLPWTAHLLLAGIVGILIARIKD